MFIRGGMPHEREDGMSFKMFMMICSFLFLQSDAGGSGDGTEDGNEDAGDAAGNGNGSDANDKAGNRNAANDKADNDAGDDEDTTGLKNALKAERTKAKNADRDLKAIRSELDALKNAGKSEEERRDADLKAAQTRAAAAEQRLQTANARVAVTDAATKANAVSVNAVFALVRDQIEYDDGEPINVPALIAQAKRDEPTLFKASAGGADGGKGGSERDLDGKQDLNALFRNLAGHR